MAGSFNHILESDCRFKMDSIDNLGDASEALEDCYTLIFFLSGYDSKKISDACKILNLVDPWDIDYDDAKAPITNKAQLK